jgi:hypothetical protein
VGQEYDTISRNGGRAAWADAVFRHMYNTWLDMVEGGVTVEGGSGRLGGISTKMDC